VSPHHEGPFGPLDCTRKAHRMSRRLQQTSLALAMMTVCWIRASPSGNTTGPEDARDFLPEPAPYAYDCDAKPGSYSPMNARVPSNRGTALKVTGFLEFLGSHIGRTLPTATVALVDDKRRGTAIVAQVRPAAPNHITFSAVAQDLRNDFASISATDKRPISFALTLTAAGNLTASVGGRSTSMSVPAFEVSRLLLSCSTAHVRFSDVQVVAAQ
jgi:hypothetical protein